MIPFLLNPTPASVEVAWFTEFPGQDHYVEYGSEQTSPAKTIKMSRLRVDTPEGKCYFRDVWRHVAEVKIEGEVVYRTVSVHPSGDAVKSELFSCRPTPSSGTPLKILLTSDHQLKPMVAVNLQKVKEIASKIDAVFFAGDCVDHPDDALQWFEKENAFFPCFREILPFAPIFCAVGNHEVMGPFDMNRSLRDQFDYPLPNDWNIITYQEIFGHKKYYAVSFGDVRLIVLFAARNWSHKKYLAEESFGDFIFEPIEKGSAQYRWLEEELKSEAFQKSKFKIVMLHNPLHSLGENSVPPFTHPIKDGLHYRYPIDQDHLIRDIEPLLTQYGVQLVFCAHSHVWNRFRSPEGIHHLETSNVGNSYGAACTSHPRILTLPKEESSDYAKVGDPNGLEPIVPTLSPIDGQPFIASNEITAFSILDTSTGAIDSYYYDTTKPDSSVVHFDQFFLGDISDKLPKHRLGELSSVGVLGAGVIGSVESR